MGILQVFQIDKSNTGLESGRLKITLFVRKLTKQNAQQYSVIYLTEVKLY